MNSNLLSYQGEVILKLHYNGKTVEFRHYNNGTGDLFESLSNYLAGNKNSIMENGEFVFIPNTMDIRKPVVEDTPNPLSFNADTETILKVEGAIPITRVGTEETNNAIPPNTERTPHVGIVYEATITYDYIRTSFTPSDKYYLCLCGVKKNVLAYIQIDSNVIDAITPGTQAIVSWIMRIKNSEEQGA